MTFQSKIFLLCQDSQLYTNLRLQNEFEQLAFDVQMVAKSELRLGPQDVFPLSQCSAGMIRSSGVDWDDIDLDASEAFYDAGGSVYNSPFLLRLLRDKTQQWNLLSRLDLSPIPSFQCRGLPTQNFMGLLRAAGTAHSSRSCSFVVKPNRGQGGRGICFFETEKSLKMFLESRYWMKDQKFLIQPLLSVRKEYRVFLLNGEVLSVLQRQPGPGDFRANFSQGGQGQIVSQVPSSLQRFVRPCQSLKGFFFGTIEIIETNSGHFYCVEVNGMPGIQELELLTQKNMASKIVKGLVTAFSLK